MDRLDSTSLHERAQRYMQGGACAPGRIHGTLGRPLYLERADGAYLFDIDGRRFLDFNNSAGATFFGYNHPRHRAAMEHALDLGFFMNYDSEFHYELARLVCESVPSAEMIRLSNTGTEATLGAIRLARGATGRDKIIHLEGHFHGMHEGAFYNHGRLGRVVEGEVETLPDSAGFPQAFSDQVVVVEGNNLDAVERAIARHRHEIAAVILEPISFNCGCMPPRPGYLQGLRDLCTDEGIILIFDEVLSGFRMALGGAQEYYGVVPDLTTLAKALAGGFPLAAIVGKAEVMNHLTPHGEVVMSGTYTGALLPVLAAIESLQMMREPEFYPRLNALAEGFYQQLNDLFREFEIPGHVRGVGARFATYFGIEAPEADYDFRAIAKQFDAVTYRAFIEKSLARGLYFHYGGWSAGGVSLPVHAGITSVHTKNHLEEAMAALREVFQELADVRARGVVG